ncbi:MAG: TldD/PmbA family protein, partial [Dehalococcoidia bacterium]
MADSTAASLALFNDRYNIDPAAMSALLGAALSRGGDFAELFFEHRTNSSIAWEDQRVKSASRTVSQGVGIRVVKGDAIGYAYSESLDPAALRRAAETASHIGREHERPVPIDATPHGSTASYYSTEQPLSDAPAREKVALLERADRAARAFDPTIARVDGSIGDELKYVLVARSDGKVVGDVQPLIRLNVVAVSDRDGARRQASWGGGGRLGMEYFSRVTPEEGARDAARQAVLQHDAIEAPAGTFPVVLAAGDSGILLHEAVGHGLEADFNRKGTSNFSGRVGQPVA